VKNSATSTEPPIDRGGTNRPIERITEWSNIHAKVVSTSKSVEKRLEPLLVTGEKRSVKLKKKRKGDNNGKQSNY